MASLIYLASPFSHPESGIRRLRYEAAKKFTIQALAEPLALFSPIVYGMDMEGEIGTPFEAWQTLNDRMIHACDEVWCLCIPGWKDSRGVKHELDLAYSLGKPIFFYSSWKVPVNACD